MNWQLILEFTKALAGPIATLVGAYLVSRMALRTFRGQKTIEKRVDWYERIYKQLELLNVALTSLASDIEKSNSTQARQSMQGVKEALGPLENICDEAFVYASARVFKEIPKFIEAVGRFANSIPQGGTIADAQSLRDVAIHFSTVVSRDIRSQMGLRRL